MIETMVPGEAPHLYRNIVIYQCNLGAKYRGYQQIYQQTFARATDNACVIRAVRRLPGPYKSDSNQTYAPKSKLGRCKARAVWSEFFIRPFADRKPFRNWLSGVQHVEQRLGLFQI